MPERKSLVLNRKKIIISAALCKIFKQIQLQVYITSTAIHSYVSRTPYSYKSYTSCIYLFFNDYLLRLFKNAKKGFNYTVLSYYALANLKLITSAGFNDQKQSATLLKYSKLCNPITHARKRRTTRRRVYSTLKNNKITNKMNF